jgi:4-oxalocrotonate tautomerase
MTIDEFDKSNFLYGEKCLGITGDDELVIVQIIVDNTRGIDNKETCFAGIAELVSTNLGI